MSEGPSDPAIYTRAQGNQIAETARVEEAKRLRALYTLRLYRWADDNLSPAAAGELMGIVRGVE